MALSDHFPWDSRQAGLLRGELEAMIREAQEGVSEPFIPERQADMLRGKVELLNDMLREIRKPADPPDTFIGGGWDEQLY